MSLRRGSVFGVLMLCLLLPVSASAQGNGVPGRIAALEAQLAQAIATIGQLQNALAAEARARQASDAALQKQVDSVSGGGVTQGELEAAVGAEAAARAAGDAALQGQVTNEATARAAFDNSIAPLGGLAPYISVNMSSLNGLAGPHVIFSGANVHVRSGHVSRDSYTENGLGNLIIGYNEPSDEPAERAGSHNLVVGPNHRYNFGVGLVMGGAHRLGSDGASVAGGFMNSANGWFSTVSAGQRNTAMGDVSAVSGGVDNTATGAGASVSGGQGNHAMADLSSVSGGLTNTAAGVLSTVGGSANQTNNNFGTFIP